MNRLLARLRYYASDAVDEWRHSPGVNLLATATLTAVLFVAGLFVVAHGNFGEHLDRWRADLRVDVYLRDDIAAERLDAVRDELVATAGVARVEYVDKDEALRRFRTWFSDLAVVPEELDTNPLPASLEVYFDSEARAAALAGTIARRFGSDDGVDEVRFDRQWLDRMDALMAVVRVGGTALGAVVLAAVVFVMASVLRLAVYARRDEIDIMLLVGATPAFVRGPFLVAGVLQGIVAAAVAIGLVEVVRRTALVYSAGAGTTLPALIAGRGMAPGSALWLAMVGVVVGLVGSYLAVRRDQATA